MQLLDKKHSVSRLYRQMEWTDKHLIAKDPTKRTEVFKVRVGSREMCVKEQQFRGILDANAAMNEALLQCRVRHPYVCEVYQTQLEQLPGGQVKAQIFMELLGDDLKRAIKKRKKENREWSADEVWTVLRGLVDALAKAQQDGISHRDIKLENLLCSPSNPVLIKLGDFGCAKWSADLLPYHTVTGTPLFFSPQLTLSFSNYLLTGQSQQHFNPVKADVYALGVCMVLMASLTETPPNSAGHSSNQSLLALLHSLSLDSVLITLLESMLTVDEESRPDFVTLQAQLDISLAPDKPASPFPDLSFSIAAIERDSLTGTETITMRVLRNEEEKVEFDETFEREELDGSLLSIMPALPLDSTILRAQCVVCGTAEMESSVSQLSLSGVCSQACLRQLQSSSLCLHCTKPLSAGKDNIPLPCNPLHCFCSKGCFLTFLGEKTGHFQKKPAITCPECETETDYDFIFAEVGGKKAFHKLAFAIRPCQICSRLKSYYQLPCHRHWLCVEHFEEGSSRQFKCEECE